MSRILVVDDEAPVRKVLSRLLQTEGHDPIMAGGGEEALKVLDSEEIDLLISDVKMDDMNGLELTRQARDRRPDLPVVLMTAYASVGTATEALKLGVFDYLQKPLTLDVLKLTIDRALDRGDHEEHDNDIENVTEQQAAVKNLIAAAPQMKHVRGMVMRVALTELWLTICGEFGTGKEAVAMAIHECSTRKEGAFLAVPCAELPEPVLEEELLGHLKRSDKNASSNGKTMMEQAEGGTVLLKDFEAIPERLQHRLMKALKDGELSCDGPGDGVRLLAATTADMEHLVERGAFAPDLYGRFGTMKIKIAPLRERPKDIVPLAMHFLRQSVAEKRKPRLASDARGALMAYGWPGNAGELQTVMEAAGAAAKDNSVAMDALPAHVAEASAGAAAPEAASSFRGESLKKFLKQELADRGISAR
ncbi:sigma-54-dependent transcriptional regulator [Verrucomicrobiota bacterium]